MKYLIWSELNKNHILFLSYFILAIIKELDKHYLISTKDIVGTFNKYYIYTSSDFLSIIPFVIIKIRSRSAKKNKYGFASTFLIKKGIKELDDPNNIGYTYSHNNIKNKGKKLCRKIKLLIIICIFDFLGIYSNVIYNLIVETNNLKFKKSGLNSGILFNIFSKYVLSIFILHSSVYKHHYFSLGINLIFLVGLVVYDILGRNDNLYFFYAIMKIISIIFYSFEDVIAKKLLSFESISPYIFLLYRGIIVNLFAILFSIAFIFVELPDENGNKSCVFNRFWKIYENKLNIFLYIIMFLGQYFVNLNVFFIVDKFSPLHFAIACILENIGSLIISIIYGNTELPEFFIKLALYIVLIFAGLVFIEFIILNFWGFQKYTKLFLQKEANEDIQQTNFRNNSEDDVSSESQIEMINNEHSIYQINKSDLIEKRESTLTE